MLGAAAQAEWGFDADWFSGVEGISANSIFPFRYDLGARLAHYRLGNSEAQIVSTDGSVYCLISLAFSLVAYSAFRLHDGVLRFFNVKDTWNVVRAVACAEVMTCVLLFTLTRLENIPARRL